MLLSCICFFASGLFAQLNNSNPIEIKILSSSDTVYLGDKKILISTLKISSDSILLQAKKDYSFIPEKNIIILDSQWIGVSLHLWAKEFKSEVFEFYSYKKDPLLIESAEIKNPFLYQAESTQPDIFKESGLNIQGNISRGVGVGNTQDLILNSNLNLQINGKLGDKVGVVAAISDQNSPIQPEGNTQQIQDFDQVYVKLSMDSSSVTLGDFLMQNKENEYFRKFYKKSRGLQLEYLDSFKNIRNNLNAEIAVSRGRFARNEIQGLEGVQGPYRLTGANNELFILIISGTESVFINGNKLERGQQNDYVIDYNTGEITFMPRAFINQFSRIVVEFQYADRNYSRSVIGLNNEVQYNKWKFRGGLLMEQDNRNQPFQQNLDLFDSLSNRSAIDILAESGDNLQLAAIQNIKRFNTFQTDRIMYVQKDTVGISIYEFTNNPESDTVFYQITFSRVGQGNGNYRQKISLSNGRVFEWVRPINGVPQGDYEPIVPLTPPQKQQMYNLGIDFQLDSFTKISAELALSNLDKNTFSGIDNLDNLGYGANLKLVNKRAKKIGNNNLIFLNNLNLESISQNFKPFERYRDVEFQRVWNKQLSNPTNTNLLNTAEHLFNYNGAISWNKFLNLKLNYSNFTRQNIFEGNNFGANLQLKHRGFIFNQNLQQLKTQSFISSNILQSENNAVENRTSIGKEFKDNSIVTLEYISEQSVFKDSLNANERFGASSFKYNQVGLKGKKSWNETILGIEVNRREDFLPDLNTTETFKNNLISNNINLELETQGKKTKDRLKLNLAYRNLQFGDTIGNAEIPGQNILARIEYQASFLKKSIQWSTFYQIGTGREQKREFTYIEVPAGRGTHTWNDYNQNQIPELNEFEIAQFIDQAKYIKVMLPTQEFIRSTNNEFNQSIKLTAPVKWQSMDKWRKTIHRFSTVHNFRSDRRSTEKNIWNILNPFQDQIEEISLLSVNSLFKNTLFFNRSNPTFGAEYAIQSSQNKQFLVQGFDSRDFDKQAINLRYNLSKIWSVVLQAEEGNRRFSSEIAPNRNYSFYYTEVFPEVFWQPNNNFRVSYFAKFYDAKNRIEFGGEKAKWIENGAQFRTFLKKSVTIDSKLSYIKIDYNGNSFSPVTYEILRGLQAGNNITWNLLLGGSIGRNIQITLNYEGRKTETAATVHVARMEARYLF
jgi:hypothetical protein